ncbi:MAG: putative glycosidase, partial [Acidimicrobiia bacterium]|nr:putative glycosidase [Acidimicrobiia bacterium]
MSGTNSSQWTAAHHGDDATTDLNGQWRAAIADDQLRRMGGDPEFDDADWAEVTVPGHWNSAFPGSDGPLLYRRQFTAPRPQDQERAWLCLDGVFYQGDLWLDGAYLGDTEGYFVPHELEVTTALAEREEHS